MKLRGVLGAHLTALVLAGAAAYAVHQFDPNAPAEGPLVLDVSADQLSQLRLETKGRTVLAARQAPGGPFQLEIREEKAPVAPPRTGPEGESPAEPPAPAEPSVQESRYRASDEFGKALERMLPLRALQSLGKLSEEQREKFGLQNAQSQLRLEARGQAVALRLGDPTYGGSSTYVERVSDGQAYLVSSSTLKTIDFRPPRFMERRLVEKPQSAVDWLQADCSGQGRRVLTRVQAAAPGQPERWAPEEDPAAADELYRNWMEKIFRLGVQEYLDQPPADSPEAPFARCRLTFRAEGKPLDELELVWRDSAPGKTESFARSGFTAGWVKLEPHAVGQVTSDLPAVFGASLPPAR
jgi:hypothetical protein